MAKTEVNIPKVRFKGFSDDWLQGNLGNAAYKLEYGLGAAAKPFDGVNKYIRITDIDDNFRVFRKDSLTSPDIDLSNFDDYILNEQDIVFARTGASVGKTYKYKNRDGKVYFAGFLIRAKIKQNFNSEFVFQNTLSEKYYNFVRLTSQRSGQPGINANEYADFEFCYPKFEEQTQIGDFFQKLDQVIELQQKALETTKDYKKSMLQKMFPQKGEKVPQIRFDGFSGDWESILLDSCITFSKGKGYSKSDLVVKGTPVVLYGSLYTNFQTNISIVNTFVVDNNNSVYSIGNEVIIPSSGETAIDIARASAVTSKGIILGGDLNILRPNHTIESIFLALTLSYSYINKYLVQRAKGNSVVHLYNHDIKDLKMLVPTLEEQQKIGAFFQKLDQQIEQQEKKLENYQQLKKAMLQRLFV